MKVYPNYHYRHICHFCGKNEAIKDREIQRDLYYIEKASHYAGVYHSARYHKITVGVPICKECSKHERNILLICFAIYISVFVASVYIFSGIFAEAEHNLSRSLRDILIACLPSFLVALLVGGAISFVVRLLMELKIDHNSFCDNYPPIKKLANIGFEPRAGLPNLKNPNLQGKGSLEMSKLNKAMADIISNDHCIVEK